MADQMRFIHNTLLAEEKVIFWTRPHWIIFGPGATAIVLSLLFMIYGPSFFGAQFHLFDLKLYELVALASFVIGLFWLAKALITKRTSEYGITDKRIIMKTGWVRRNSLEIFLDKVEALHVDQTIPGRILNYGTILIIGTGGTKDPFFNIPRPLNFRKIAQQQIDLEEQRREINR